MIGCETIGVSINNIFVQVDKIVKMGVVKRNNGKPIITIIDKRFTLDGNYEFYGIEKNFYDDKSNVKREIIKQLNKIQGLNM
jgi:hypothetical protein